MSRQLATSVLTRQGTAGGVGGLWGRRWLDKPWLPLIPFLAMPALGATPAGMDQLIIASEAIFLLMALGNPVWALGALALSELSIRNYLLDMGGFQISARLLISGFSLLLVLPYLSRNESLGPRARPMLLAAAGFIAVTTVANIFTLSLSGVFEFLRFIITGLIVVMMMPLLIRRPQDLQKIGLPVLAIVAISAVVALLQRFAGESVLAVIPHGSSPAPPSYWSGRSLGISENPIYLANEMMLFLFLILGLLLMKSFRGLPASALVALFLLAGSALYYSQTRSWAYSAVGAALAIAFSLRGRIQKEFVLLLLLAGAVFFWYGANSDSRYSFDSSDGGSAAIRPVLWSAALQMALDNPILGVGYNRFLELAPQYESFIDPGLLKNQGAGTALGQYDPHNDYLNIWASFGIAALALYGAVIVQALLNFFAAFQRGKDLFLRGMALGGLAALVAFAVNSIFHNLIESTLTVWILAGLSLTLVKLVAEEPARSLEEAKA